MSRLARALRGALLVLAPTEALALLALVAGVPVPAAARTAIGAVLAVVVLAEALLWGGHHRRARSAGARRSTAVRTATDAVLPPVVARLARYDRDVWRSLFAWTTRRRPGAGPADLAFGYRGPLLPALLAVTAVSVAEVVTVDVLLPWPRLRLLLLVLGVWGVLFVLGLIAVLTVHPHLVGPDGVRVRSGAQLALHLPWSAITTCERRLRHHDGRSVDVCSDARGTGLRVATSGQTNLDLILEPPLRVGLPDGRTPTVSVVHLYADDPTAFARALEAHRRVLDDRR